LDLLATLVIGLSIISALPFDPCIYESSEACPFQLALQKLKQRDFYIIFGAKCC